MTSHYPRFLSLPTWIAVLVMPLLIAPATAQTTPLVSSGGDTLKMYWTDYGTDKIQRANLDGSNVEDLITTGLTNPRGLALDVGGGKMYWTDLDLNKIQRADLDGSNVEDLITRVSTRISRWSWSVDLALDVGGGKMYWTDLLGGRIRRADLDGSNVEDLIRGLITPHIALDVGGGKMYWTDSNTFKIQRADLDGSNVEDLITTGLSFPVGIALDVGGGKMYWTEESPGKIQRADLDGSNVEDLITRASGLRRPQGIALDVGGGKMYWVDQLTDKIQRADLDGSNVEDLITTGLTTPFGIALDKPTVTLALSPTSISEAGGVATVSAKLSHRLAAATTITVRPVTGAYTVGSDSTITIAAGDTTNASDTVVITAVNNTTDAPSKRVTVFGVASDDTVSVLGAALTLEDDDASPTVTLMLSPSSISEAGGVSTVSAVLSRPSSEATTITVRPVANAYTVGSDSTITIAAGDTTNASDTVAITAVDNGQYEVTRAVTVSGVARNDQGVGRVTGAALTLEDDDAPKMYWTDYGTDKIQRVNIDGSNVEDLITTGLNTPVGIALDVGRGKMYWTDYDARKIQRADLDGSNVEDLITSASGLRNPSGIALDVGGGKMYWMDTGTDKIQRADLDGSNVEDLITTGLREPYGIALDVGGGKMYWTDYGTDKIQRADLDGSNVEDLITTGLNTPVGIALDVGRGKMYWTEESPGKIQRADLDGSNVEDLITTGLSSPIDIALDVGGGKMYWTDWSTDKILRADLDGSNVEDLITTGLTTPNGIALDKPTVTLALSPTSISEAGGVATVSAKLSHLSRDATTITVRPVTGAYTVDQDSTITIAAGDTTNASDTVVITAVNNTTDAPDKRLGVSGTVAGDDVASMASGALTITDDDAAPDVTLMLSPSSISEAGGVSTVSATLSRPSSEATTITVRPVTGAYTVGSGFDDCHRGWGHDERVGHGSDHGGGQRSIRG